MYGYVYLTTNLLNGKKYIGQHKATKFDVTYFGSGKILLQAINKNGIENFTCVLVESANSKKDLDKKEIKYIKKYNAVESSEFYNLVKGGSGNSIKGAISVTNGEVVHQIHPDELQKYLDAGFVRGRCPRTKEAIEKTAMSNRGKKRTKESCEKISCALKGKLISDTHRQNLRDSHKGQLPPMTGKIQVNNGEDYRFIFPSEWETYQEMGYVRGGRKRGHSSAHGKIVVNKEGKKYYILPEELDTYLAKGYQKGFNTKKKTS